MIICSRDQYATPLIDLIIEGSIRKVPLASGRIETAPDIDVAVVESPTFSGYSLTDLPGRVQIEVAVTVQLVVAYL